MSQFRRRLLVMMQKVQEIWRDVVMTGTGIVIANDTTEGQSVKVFPQGWTEQVQTTGANLFDEKLLLDFDSENYDKTQSGSGFYYYKFPVNGTVTASTKNANKNGEYLTVGIKPDGSDKTWLSHGSAAISKYKTLTPEDGNIYLGVNNSLERVKSMIQNTGGIIINEGSAAKPYEPYTGGKPSPSPEYPQEIKNVGKRNEEKQKYEVDVIVCNSGYLQKGSYEKNIRALPLEKGKTYRIYVGVPSRVVNTGILDEERTFISSSQLYSYCNKPEYPYNNTGVVSGKCRLNQLLDMAHTFTVTVDGLYLYQAVNASNHDTDNAYVAYDFIDEVDMNASYTEQTLTLTSDRPITKWDRLVEQGGQIGWLYQSNTVVIDGSETWSSSNVPDHIYFTTTVNNKSGRINTSLCKTYKNNGEPVFNKKHEGEYNIYSDHPTNGVSDTAFVPPNETVTTIPQWKEWLNANPIEMLYKTKTTEFIPLSESEQDAVRNLKTYYPTTVISNDQNAFMQIEYRTKYGGES